MENVHAYQSITAFMLTLFILIHVSIESGGVHYTSQGFRVRTSKLRGTPVPEDCLHLYKQQFLMKCRTGSSLF